jgi:hypothetical protein
MINFHEINIGDLVLSEYGGQIKEGEVINLNGDEKQVCVESGDQEFWFEAEHVFPIPLSDEQMLSLNFSKEIHEDGSVKYFKDSFRLVIKADHDFSSLEMWYREDKRVHPDVHYVHQLQNQFLQMTKVPLTKDIV